MGRKIKQTKLEREKKREKEREREITSKKFNSSLK